jgi:hypothetical protein
MKREVIRRWLFALLLLVAGSEISHATVGWPEAVARLARERAKAVTCVGLLKRYGDERQRSLGQLIYGDARAEIDAAISGLIVALAQDGRPEGLPSLNTRLERGATDLGKLCQTVMDLVPNTSGHKNVLIDIARGALEPLINSLKEAAAALYNNYRKDGAETRLTIRTRLEAAKWPTFADVEIAQ